MISALRAAPKFLDQASLGKFKKTRTYQSKKTTKRHADSDLSDQEPEPEEEPEEVALKQRSSSRKSKKEKVS